MPTIELGELVRALGLRGELRLRESVDFWPEALDSAHLELVVADVPRRVRVLHARVHSPGMRAVFIEGVEDRDAAESVVGARLRVELENLDVPEPEERRPFQVVDMEVVLPDGSVLGRVADVLQMPAHAVFVVRNGTREYLIPDAPNVVREVDVRARRMRIEPIPGLLEL